MKIHALRDFRRRNTVPPRCHPLVRRLVEEANAQRIGLRDLSDRAGLHKDTIRSWTYRGNPRLPGIEAAFGVLGLRLYIGHEGGAPGRPRKEDAAS